jgi:quinol monooxygenase YgiN
MVAHVVIFTWRDGVDSNQTAAFGEALDGLASELSDLATIRHGADLGYRDGNGDYALVATFADRAAWDAYQAHPKHKAFLREMVEPLVAARLAIQF